MISPMVSSFDHENQNRRRNEQTRRGISVRNLPHQQLRVRDQARVVGVEEAEGLSGVAEAGIPQRGPAVQTASYCVAVGAKTAGIRW
jgi:hypothetical protein